MQETAGDVEHSSTAVPHQHRQCRKVISDHYDTLASMTIPHGLLNCIMHVPEERVCGCWQFTSTRRQQVDNVYLRCQLVQVHVLHICPA